MTNYFCKSLAARSWFAGAVANQLLRCKPSRHIQRHAIRGLRLAALLAWLCTQSPAQHGRVEPPDMDEATFASSRLQIPEPMVFDLVRPLGAPKGELEVNSLFRISEFAGRRVLQWAPEVEYTFADGYGVEFEIPLENGHLEAYKCALQGKLKRFSGRNYLMGWQGILEWERATGRVQTDLLHLFGLQMNPNWSMFSMNGVRRYASPTSDLAYLGNHTVFRRFSRKLEVGLETNLQASPARPARFMAMPQMLYRLHGYNIQAGLGGVAHNGVRAKASWRLSREF